MPTRGGVAMARELVGFLGAMATQGPVTPAGPLTQVLAPITAKVFHGAVSPSTARRDR